MLDRVLASLAEALIAEAEPGAGLLDDLVLAGEVHDVARPRDPAVEEELAHGVDVLGPGQRQFDDGQARPVRAAQAEAMDGVEDLGGLVVDVGADRVTPGGVDGEAGQHGGQRRRGRRP